LNFIKILKNTSIVTLPFKPPGKTLSRADDEPNLSHPISLNFKLVHFSQIDK